MLLSFLNKKKKKKGMELNCGNGITEIGGKIWQLWQCYCRKWEEKKKDGCRNLRRN